MGKRYEVGMLWSDPEAYLANNYCWALGQLYALEQKLQRDTVLKEFYKQSIDTDAEQKFVKILVKSEVKRSFGNEWHQCRTIKKWTQTSLIKSAVFATL